MNSHRTLFTAAAVAGAFVLGCMAPAYAADTHRHAADEPGKLKLDTGKKWATDKPLRRHMAEIHAAIATKYVRIRKETLAAGDYMALGRLIEARVASIVSECKLEPAADTNLHLIVAELISGADAMQGKSRTTPTAGAAQTMRAVNNYGRYFSHAGWKPLG